MKRKNFSLVWGRKLFFGVGWPILLLIGLGFFLTGTMPESVLGLALGLLQLIGETGLIILLSFFLIFYPLVHLIPTYYFSRIWSTGILLSIMSIYSLNSYTYILYDVHLNSFIIQHLLLKAKLLEWKAYLVLIPLFIITVFMWMRGNRIWKIMQGKFMNTNSNWYLWIIIFSFISTQGINLYNQFHQLKYVQMVLEKFPINLPIIEIDVFASSKKGVTKRSAYPIPMTCESDKNFLFVIYQSAPEYLKHVAEHGVEFKNHYSVKSGPQLALNNLLYAFPKGLQSSDIAESQMVSVLRENNYHLDFFTTNPEIQIDGVKSSKKIVEVKKWLATYNESSSTQNFALFMYIDNNRVYEKTLNDLIINLNTSKLLDNTIVVFTSLEGDSQNDLMKTPLVLLWEGKGKKAVSKMTTSYDLIPTLIEEGMGCKDERRYSFGNNLFSDEANNYFVYTKQEKPYVWIHDLEVSFSLKDLDYISEHINTSEILQLRKLYYDFFN